MDRPAFYRIALAASLLAVPGVWAQSTATLLQRAIYAEETAGELEEAATLYQQILRDAQAPAGVTARARYRLAGIDATLGRNESAIAAYQQLLSILPPDSVLRRNAEDRLAELSPMVLRSLMTTDLDTRDFTPDGKKVLYVDWGSFGSPETEGEVAYLDLETGDSHVITGDGASGVQMAGQVVASPDGNQAAYVWLTGEEVELRIIGLDGSGKRTLWTQPGLTFRLYDWSATGRILIARSSDAGWEMATVDIDTGDVRSVLALGDHEPGGMEFSADGQFIVYDYRPDEDTREHDLFVVGPDGAVHGLVEHPARDFGARWSPGGRWIVFCSDRSGNYAVYRLRVENGRARGTPELVVNVETYRPYGFTSDGKFRFDGTHGGQDVYVANLDPVTGLPVGEAEHIGRRFEGHNSAPALSPDGQRLAYLRRFAHDPSRSSDEQDVIVLRSLTTGEERVLTEELFVHDIHNDLRWFPDGASLLVPGNRPDGEPGLFRVDVTTGEITRLGDLVGSHPSLSPDGRKVHAITGDRARVVEYDLATGEQRTLLETDGAWNAVLSPDGERIALLRFDFVKLVEPSGETRELVPSPNPKGMSNGPVWSTDGRWIWFTIQGPDGGEACRVPVAGGPYEVAKVFPAIIRHLGFSADGRRMAYTLIAVSGSVYELTDFLPPS